MENVDLRRYAAIVWRWAWLIALAMTAAGIASYEVASSMTPTYMSSLTVMVGEDPGDPNVTADELTLSQRAANSYAAMVRRQPVLDATVKQLGLRYSWSDLQQRVQANRVEGTQLLEIRVIDSNPARAKVIVEELARQLTVQSATAETTRQQEERQQFVHAQLDQLQSSILQAEVDISGKNAQVKNETSARAVLDLQDEIRALQTKLEGWRSTYATLLSSYQGKRQPNAVTVVEPASQPTQPVSPNVGASVLASVGAGFLLALAGVLIAEYVNDVIRTEDDLQRASGLPALALVPRIERTHPPTRALVTVRDPNAAASEAYRVLRANVKHSLANLGPSLILVTSPGSREGKSVTSSNLAASFAQAGQSTILVDADLRRPCLHEIFGVPNSSGLAQLLEPSSDPDPRVVGHEAVDQLASFAGSFLVPTAISLLRLLPSGSRPPVNPAELLVSSRMDLLLQALREMADVVIIDSPPLLPVVDATILAARVDGVVLVVQSGRTRRQLVAAGVQILRRAGANALGATLNATPEGSRLYREYYHSSPEKRPEQVAPRSFS